MLESSAPPQDRVSSPVSAGDVSFSDVTSSEEGGDGVRLGQGNEVASESNNDSDEFGVGMVVRVEAVHSVFSPNGKFRRSVSSSWQRGQLLGSGFYGTVYEGFTE